MKGRGPKSLLSLGAESVLDRQVRLLAPLNPAAVVVVGGFELHRLRKKAPPGVTVVANPDYEETNVARSIAQGMDHSLTDAVLVVYGDLVFPPSLFHFDRSTSCLVVCENLERNGEVGVGGSDTAVHLEYGFGNRWAQVALFKGDERELFVQLASRDENARRFGYEVINAVIDAGGEFAVRPYRDWLFEIDTPQDLYAARAHLTPNR